MVEHPHNCFTIHVETLDEGTVLQTLYNETNWVVVTNKYCCINIGVKFSTKCHVGSDCCQKINWLKLYLCNNCYRTFNSYIS